MVSDPGFLEFMVDALRRLHVDIYVPILDEEILVAAELREARRLPEGLKVWAPRAEVSDICLDKLRAAEWLKARGLPCPATSLARDARWTGVSLFAKERRGVASRGARVIDTDSALVALNGATDIVVQELCAPPEVTVDCYRSRDGEIFAGLCRERIEVKAGVCTKARAFNDLDLLSVARRIGDELPLDGAFCIQAMVSPRDGTWAITDVNPRVGAGTQMSAALGFDPGAAAIAAAMGLSPERYLERPYGEHIVVRTYEEWAM